MHNKPVYKDQLVSKKDWPYKRDDLLNEGQNTKILHTNRQNQCDLIRQVFAEKEVTFKADLTYGINKSRLFYCS